MNAIVALCHFCEIHGPKVLFCTQPYHPEEKILGLENVENLEAGDGTTQGRRGVLTPSSSLNEPQTPSTPTGGHNSLPNFKNDMCEGCTSVHIGFVSHDEDAEVSYVSLQRPHHRDVFSMIRQSCIRSLSCEVCPGREGPMFFGDAQQGYAISYTFYIKDNQARGFKRLYSILVVMMDKIYLLNSWPFLVKHIETVVNHLKEKADGVYEEEKVKFPQRHIRLAGSVNPKTYIQHRGGANKPARSLNELTDDRNVFKILHLAFVWILKACGNRLSETLLEGPPTEDSIIDMEKQEETEEGFVKLFSKKCGFDEDIEEAMDPLAVAASKDDTLHVIIEDDTPEVKDIRHLAKVLKNTRFHILAHNAIVGNQIIVRGQARTLTRTLIQAVTALLPKGCFRAIYYSEEYVASYRCNFLGLGPDISIPSYVSEPYLVVDVYNPPETETGLQPFCGADQLELYKFKLSSSAPIEGIKPPTVLVKMELAIWNDKLTVDVVNQCLICLKEEWMNKVKVLFKFTKTGGSRSDEDTKNLLKVVGAQQEDKALLSYWMQGLSSQYKDHIRSTSRHQLMMS